MNTEVRQGFEANGLWRFVSTKIRVPCDKSVNHGMAACA